MEYGILGDFVKNHPLNGFARIFFVQSQGRQQMPGNGLALAVGVGCQQQVFCILERRLDCVNMFFAFREDMILGGKVLLDIHRALFAWERPDMTERGQNLEIFPEEFFNGFRLGWRLDYNEILRHGVCCIPCDGFPKYLN